MASNGTETTAEQELQQLKALVAEQQQRLDALETPNPSEGDNGKEQKSTRRQLLKLAGAAVAGAAGSAALRAIPASAADGDTMTVGTVFSETLGNFTGVTDLSASGGGLFGYGFNAGTGVEGKSFTGVGTYGIGVFTGSTGVVGTGVASGVVGSGQTGVSGVSSTGTGSGVHAQTNATSSRSLFAYTSATNSIAVEATSMLAPAIVAKSYGTGLAPGIVAQGRSGIWAFSTYSGTSAVAAIGHSGGPDIKAAGSGRIVQFPNIAGGIGAPNFTTAGGYFEMIRAKDGAMWINRGTGTLQASWKRVNAVRVDSSDGTGAPFAPFRVFDTRSGAKKTAGSVTVVPIAGQGAGASNIPSDAVAVIGNLTATQYTGGGFLAISPAGVTVTTSTVNFITGQAAIANSFIVGLGTGGNAGKVQVKVAGHASHFLVDITGYLQ